MPFASSFAGGQQSATPGLGSALEGAFGSAAEDALARQLLPAQGGSQASRDATDAKHADDAFNSVLASAVLIAEAWATPAHVAAIASGIFTAGSSAATIEAWVQGVISAAAAAVRLSWAKMPVAQKARIWRGEF